MLLHFHQPLFKLILFSLRKEKKKENTHTHKPPKDGRRIIIIKKSVLCSVPSPTPPALSPSPESWKMQMMEGGSAVLVHGQGVVCGPRR